MRATIFLALILVALPAYVLAAQAQDLLVPDRTGSTVFDALIHGVNTVQTDGIGSVNGSEILLAKREDHDRSDRDDDSSRHNYGRRDHWHKRHFGFSFSTPYYGGYYYDRPYYDGSYCYLYSPYRGYYRAPHYYCYNR